jgi:hypothetical protein
MVGHGGNWKGRLDPLVPGAVVIEVDEIGCLEAGIIISGKFDGRVMDGLTGDGKCLVKKELYVTFAKGTETKANGVVKIGGLIGLGWVKNKGVK